MRRNGNANDIGERVDTVLGEGLVSDATFRNLLEAQLSGPEGVGYAFQLTVTDAQGDQIARYDSGERPAGDPIYARTLLDDTDAVRCRCEIWLTSPRSGSAADPNDLAGLIEAMVRRHWGSRDPHTVLPYLKNAGVPAQFSAAARSFGSSPVAVLHTDLDEFKAINTEFEETGGDKVLAEFARRFRLAFAELGVTVRTGGDEFSAILSLDDPLATIQAAEAFRAQMEQEPFAAIGRTNTCSIGLCLYEDGSVFAEARNQDPILADARNAEVRAKEEGRNRICLFGPIPTAECTESSVDSDTLLRTALAARRVFRAEPGSTVAAVEAAIRSRLADELANSKSIEEGVDKVRNRLGLLIGTYSQPTGRPAELAGILDSMTWAQMVASAMFETTYKGAKLLKPSDTLTMAVTADGSVGIEVSGQFIPIGPKVKVDGPLSAAMGHPFYPHGEATEGSVSRLAGINSSSGGDPVSPVLLLPIGDDAKAIADDLAHVAAAIIDIDDRPARGGGLPDFWQSNLSRVIRAVLANPNITSVVAIGEEEFARQTISRLRDCEKMDVDDLQRRLSMNSVDLSTFLERKLSVLLLPANRTEALKAIGKVIRELQPLDFENRPIIDQLQRSRRRLAIPSPNRTNRLDILDGLRVKTLADAYPEALQLVRGAVEPDDHKEPRRGLFREMTGFKIVLTDPQNDKVPDYWRDETETFERYFRDSFVETSGPFGKRLNGAWPGGTRSLSEFAVAQTVEAVMKGVPTRRINIPIIPDELEHPLGLSSIQIMPREHDGIETLDMIFVWRTVDALVGFPFSAYGSIRWSEDFLEAVSKKIEAEQNGRRLRFGTLTYIALSFHMYLHDGDVEIARTIVQDASF